MQGWIDFPLPSFIFMRTRKAPVWGDYSNYRFCPNSDLFYLIKFIPFHYSLPFWFCKSILYLDIEPLWEFFVISTTWYSKEQIVNRLFLILSHYGQRYQWKPPCSLSNLKYKLRIWTSFQGSIINVNVIREFGWAIKRSFQKIRSGTNHQ